MRTTRQFWNFRASTTDPSVGELLLYGTFGPDDGLGWLLDTLSPKQFREDLDALGNIAALKVYVQSDGGDVFAAQAIHSILKRYPKPVTAIVDGWAASSASFVVAAANEVLMPANAMMMVHSPWAIARGNSREFRAMADQLDKVQESIIAAYRDKTGLTDERLAELLDAETWMTAQDAVDLGFADSIEPAVQIAASARRPAVWPGEMFDLRNRILPQDAPAHGAFTGRHIHSHAANGVPGGDVMHHHVHEHNGDYHHEHDHLAAMAVVQVTSSPRGWLRLTPGTDDAGRTAPAAAKAQDALDPLDPVVQDYYTARLLATKGR